MYKSAAMRRFFRDVIVRLDHKALGDLESLLKSYSDKARFEKRLANFLMEHKVDSFLRDKFGNTILHLAVMEGDFNEAWRAITDGVKVNATNDKGLTALHCAVEFNHSKLVNFLLNARADIEAQDLKGKSPLVYAVEKNCSELILHELISYGADPYTIDKLGNGLLHYASQTEMIDSLNCLLLNINMQNSYGETALHRAAARGNYEMVGCLLANGADSRVLTDKGQTAKDVAIEKEYFEIASLLHTDQKCYKVKLKNFVVQAS